MVKDEEKREEVKETKVKEEKPNEKAKEVKPKKVKKKVKQNKTKIIVIVLSVFILLALTIFILYNPVKLSKENLEISYGEIFVEPGYKAIKYGQDYTKKVKVKNNINYKKIGEYKVLYSVKIFGITYKKERIVKIVDDKKPEIKLKGNIDTDVCPNTQYKEEGYEAIDNYDGDLTSKVKTDISLDKIVYTVTDSSKNKFEVIRNLIYQDKTKPEIKLNGSDKVSIIIGNKYSESGAIASDNCDGDISKNITTEGNVDTNKIGTYNITYKVKDSAGNESSVTRTVSVIKRSVLNDGRPGTIYLTFDDGPNEGTTNVILDILKEEGVKATFFVTNKGPDYLIKREHDEGHTVALHTASHNYAVVYASDDAYFNDLYSVQNRVKRITGETSMIVRFPGGSSNTVSKRYSPGIMSRLTASLVSKGYKYYDWNISSGDAGETSVASGVYNNVTKNLRKNRANMVLMHDIKPYTRDALRNIIKYGKEAGYTFERITMDTPMITQGVNN